MTLFYLCVKKILISPMKWYNEQKNSSLSETITWVSCFLSFYFWSFRCLMWMTANFHWQKEYNQDELLRNNSLEQTNFLGCRSLGREYKGLRIGSLTENSTEEARLQFEIKIIGNYILKQVNFYYFLMVSLEYLP